MRDDSVVNHFYFSFTPNQIEKRLDKLRVLEQLSDNDDFPVFMASEIRPHIAGTDMARLLLYYKIIGDSPSGETISAETHRRLLAKLIPAAPGTVQLVDTVTRAIFTFVRLFYLQLLYILSLSSRLWCADGM